MSVANICSLCILTWIDHRVAVAQPEEDREEKLGDAVLAESSYQVYGEKGQPVWNEAVSERAQASTAWHAVVSSLIGH